VAQSYTAIPKVNAKYLNGEMVAMGTLAQLMMESRPDEAARVAEFFAAVGRPVHLGQALARGRRRERPRPRRRRHPGVPVHRQHAPATHGDRVRASVLDAHGLGLSVSATKGTAAYDRLHGSELR